MRFNYDKLKRGTHGSGYYADWDEEMIETFGRAGFSRPISENDIYTFILSISYIAKNGSKRRGLLDIHCHPNGEIKDEMLPLRGGYLTSAIEAAANFISVMSEAGYIIKEKN